MTNPYREAFTLLIAGEQVTFVPLNVFRVMHGLPEQFSIRQFDPKDNIGLAHIDQAGGIYHELETAVMAAIPQSLSILNLLYACDHLEMAFRAALELANPGIGLRDVEIDYAVAGFADMLSRWSYALIQAKAVHQPAPEYRQVYGDWLGESMRIASREIAYAHDGDIWQIRVVNHVYGRIGLQVRMASGIHYVADHTHACPAEAFMARLLRMIARQLAELVL